MNLKEYFKPCFNLKQSPKHARNSSTCSKALVWEGSPVSKAESDESVSGSFDKVSRGPLDYLLATPGKDIRGQLIYAFNKSLEVPTAKLLIIQRVVELLHTASLLIDDIQDGSELRRGIPVAHKVYGIPQTINSANYAYFLAQNELVSLHPEGFQIFTEELLNLHLGQGMDLYWRDSLTCPSADEYLDMVSKKTGGLFRLAIRLMQLESPHTLNLVPLVDKLGILFQIRDDYQNLQSKAYSDNKGFCEDLTEGKFSFPIIHSIHSQPDNSLLLNILRQRSTEYAVKCHGLKYMESTGSLAYCEMVICNLVDDARGYIKETVGQEKGDGLQKVLDLLDLRRS